MTKSRFRYWLGVAYSIGLLTAFFKIGSRADQHEGYREAPRNNQSKHDGHYTFQPNAALEKSQYDPEYVSTAFLNGNDHDSLISAAALPHIEAQQAWEWLNAGKAILLDLRSYDDYQTYHPQGAQSFSAARLADLEATFPNKTLVYIFLQWQNDGLAAVMHEFRQRGYHHLGALDMRVSRPGHYKMNEWEQAQLPVARKNVLQIEAVEIKWEKYAILSDSLGAVKTLARFPKPSAELLMRYRPQIIEHFGYDEDNEEFRSGLGEIESVISAATLADHKIWVGFSFYEGERNKGYGGIGFYDLPTGAIGVLRHPALVNHSVRDLMVTNEMIYVATVDEFQLSREIGNGLVMIERKTLQVSALVPPGTSVVWHKDGGENAALFYEKSIAEILADRRLVAKTVEGWNPNEFITALNLGLERYMIETAEQEFKNNNFTGSLP